MMQMDYAEQGRQQAIVRMFKIAVWVTCKGVRLLQTARHSNPGGVYMHRHIPCCIRGLHSSSKAGLQLSLLLQTERDGEDESE